MTAHGHIRTSIPQLHAMKISKNGMNCNTIFKRIISHTDRRYKSHKFCGSERSEVIVVDGVGLSEDFIVSLGPRKHI